MSFLFAVLIIVEIAVWHREGMSSMLGVSVSWRIFETCVGVWVVFCLISRSGGCLCGCCVVCSFFVLRRFVSLRSLVRRLSCLLSECVRGGVIFRVHVFCLFVPLTNLFVLVRGMCLAC